MTFHCIKSIMLKNFLDRYTQNQTPDILKKILEHKKKEVHAQSEKVSLRTLHQKIADSPPPRGFAQAIEARLQLQQIAIIAEIKKASPSKGLLRPDFQPAQIAQSYENNGAACLSVLTDKHFFQGANDYLQQVHVTSALPILRKDFIIDPYQIYEARAIGADCILLIVAALDDVQLHDFIELTTHLSMDVLVEVHNQVELERALQFNFRLVGINNRNLHTFNTDLETTLNLLPQIPKKRIVISESGIYTSQDIALLSNAGISTFLIGEAFMKASDPGVALANLFN